MDRMQGNERKGMRTALLVWGSLVALLLAPLVFAATPALADRKDGGGKDEPSGQEEIHHEGSDHFEEHHGPTGMGQGWGPRMEAVLDKLNKEQQEAFRKARMETRRKLNTLGAELKNLRLDLKEEMRKIPLEIQGALTVWTKIQAFVGRTNPVEAPGGKPAPEPSRNSRSTFPSSISLTAVDRRAAIQLW